MLHVAQISFYFDRERRDPERLLSDWPTLVDVAEAAHSSGVRVSVIQAAVRDAHIGRNRVDYHFVAPREATTSIAKGNALPRLLKGLRPDVVHVHGLGFPNDVLALRRIASEVPVLLQDHADRVPRIWRRGLWRRALSTASGIAFCSRAQARPFLETKLLPATTSIYEIPESTSRFSPGDQDEARNRTGLHGTPCLLWVGHLNENKDPLTVLAAVRSIIPDVPNLHLWCCFGTAPLLEAVTRAISGDPLLQERVHLLGRVEHARIEHLMRAADVFVLGSHREGSGYSLIEALACGLPVAITDIPSFRALTGDVGRLWACGNASSLTQALRDLTHERPSRAQVRAHFDAELSLAAVGRKLCAAYEDLRRSFTNVA